MFFRDVRHDGIREQRAAARERRVRGHDDPALLAIPNERVLREFRVPLDLVHRGRDPRRSHQLLELRLVEIRDAD
jgi:hypothetical protein